MYIIRYVVMVMRIKKLGSQNKRYSEKGTGAF